MKHLKSISNYQLDTSRYNSDLQRKAIAKLEKLDLRVNEKNGTTYRNDFDGWRGKFSEPQDMSQFNFADDQQVYNDWFRPEVHNLCSMHINGFVSL